MTEEGSPRRELDALLAQLGGWVDAERAGTAARARSRRGWLRQQAGESTTLLGVLLSLAESGSAVTVRTAAGTYTGTLDHVATGLCALELDGGTGRMALIAISAITAVEGDHGQLADDRSPELVLDLAATLAGLAGDRPMVELHLAGGSKVAGTLTAVGTDVLTVRRGPGRNRGPDGAAVVHVPLSAVSACVLI
ncbi:MAG: hypothetical protein M3N98_10490 [Actinomycetota bacterium]|nr:hypothetical protein [Actinomycetota bacterium]